MVLVHILAIVVFQGYVEHLAIVEFLEKADILAIAEFLDSADLVHFLDSADRLVFLVHIAELAGLAGDLAIRGLVEPIQDLAGLADSLETLALAVFRLLVDTLALVLFLVFLVLAPRLDSQEILECKDLMACQAIRPILATRHLADKADLADLVHLLDIAVTVERILERLDSVDIAHRLDGADLVGLVVSILAQVAGLEYQGGVDSRGHSAESLDSVDQVATADDLHIQDGLATVDFLVRIADGVDLVVFQHILANQEFLEFEEAQDVLAGAEIVDSLAGAEELEYLLSVASVARAEFQDFLDIVQILATAGKKDGLERVVSVD